MRRLTIILMIALFAGGTLSFAPNEHTGGLDQSNVAVINWLSWEEAIALHKKEKKKILLAVYTDWCGWCKRMESATFEPPDIASYVNQHFYAVKFDAEQKQELEYKGKAYRYLRAGKRNYHELAAELLRGQMSFPSVVFLDEDQEHIQTIAGFKTPQQFEKIATYFAEDHYKATPWSTYEKGYQPVLIKDE